MAEKDFASLEASASDLATAWQDRLNDARTLLDAGRPGAAMYLGIYAVEIALKARICRVLGLGQMPRAFQIHDLLGLATCAGLRSRLELESFQGSSVEPNWSLIYTASKKQNDYRYKPDSGWSLEDATQLLIALEDPTDGVIPWIQQQP